MDRCEQQVYTDLVAHADCRRADEPNGSVRTRSQPQSNRLSVNAELSARLGGNYHISQDDATGEQGQDAAGLTTMHEPAQAEA